MGAELCLAHDMGGEVEAYGGPLSVEQCSPTAVSFHYGVHAHQITF